MYNIMNWSKEIYNTEMQSSTSSDYINILSMYHASISNAVLFTSIAFVVFNMLDTGMFVSHTNRKLVAFVVAFSMLLLSIMTNTFTTITLYTSLNIYPALFKLILFEILFTVIQMFIFINRLAYYSGRLKI